VNSVSSYGCPVSLVSLLGVIVADIEASPEALDSTRRIQNSLLAGIEWVTLRADINLEDRLRAAYLESITARTRDSCLYVIGVNT
jgi:hypothetical protein